MRLTTIYSPMHANAKFILLVLALAFTTESALAQVTSKPIDGSTFARTRIGTPGTFVTGATVIDNAGEHILVLTQLTGPSLIEPGNANERTHLQAGYYSQSASKWVRGWTITDGVDCPGLDHTAQFFPKQVTVTDLDKNGMAEVTVAYKLFCGGGVDPATLKIIMRQGDQKFAMRGTTRIVVPGQAPFGGEANFDTSLSKPANAVFRRHIETVRMTVVTEKY